MKALAKQDVQLRSGQTLIAQLMAAGEFHMGMALAHRIEKMKEQGAPVEWVTTFDPITASLHPIAVGARGPGSSGSLFEPQRSSVRRRTRSALGCLDGMRMYA